MTPNPEIILKARTNNKLRIAINEADIAIADGVGLTWAAKTLVGQNLTVIKGRELMLELLELAGKEGSRVFFLGSTGKVIEGVVTKARSLFPKASFKGAAGPQITDDGEPTDRPNKAVEKQTIKDISAFRPDFLFVAFGAPKQELWVKKNYRELSASIIMVVGGALDYYSGQKPLPPRWMAHYGLEWLWRLMIERRLMRILNATIVFPAVVLKHKYLGSPDDCCV